MVFVHKRIRTKPRKTKAYVNNKDFYQAILDYRETIKEYEKKLMLSDAEKAKLNAPLVEPEIPRYIGECIMMICSKLSGKPNFFGYSYRDEMVADAIENCLNALKRNFDPKKSNNPFAYFTSVAYNAFIRRLNMERDESLAKAFNFEAMFLFDSESSNMLQFSANEFTDNLMRNYQAREAKKRAAKHIKRNKKKKTKKKSTVF